MKKPEDSFYAHFKKGDLSEKRQPLEEHLKNVAEMAKGFAGELVAELQNIF